MRRARSIIVVAALIATTAAARADEDEMSVEAHVIAGAARVGEEGTHQVASVPVAGVTGELNYGIRDWLALGGELAYAQTGAAHFDMVPVVLRGVPEPAAGLDRSARLARAIVGGTLRLGVRVVPTIFVGAGAALRMRPGATYTPTGDVPDDHAASTTIDLVIASRVGLDYRINRRWLVGLWAGAIAAVPFGAPSFQSAEGGLRVEYAWYPMIF